MVDHDQNNQIHERCHYWDEENEETFCRLLESYHEEECVADEEDANFCQCGRQVCRTCIKILSENMEREWDKF